MEDFSTTFKYSFQSETGPLGVERFIREFTMDIYASGIETEQLIGNVVFKIVYVDHALNSGAEMVHVFDIDGYVYQISEDIFDFDAEELNEDILDFYDFALLNSNLCIIEGVDLLPEYKGYSIVAKAIKDILYHFDANCGLFVLEAYPLQFKRNSDEERVHWRSRLRLNEFPPEEKLAFEQLRDYYISIGFDSIPAYKNLLFYNPAIENKRIDAIDLEE